MILVDTSVWVGHFRHGEAPLSRLLEEGLVLTHPLVIEELSCGALADRGAILRLLHALPWAPGASHPELLSLIEAERLGGSGLGAVDAHLLASARLSRARLWTFDGALARAARRLGVLAVPPS